MRKRLLSKQVRDSFIKQAIRVNHAGEYGAVRIYTGQREIFNKQDETGETIQHMLEQEEVHLKYFNEALRKERVRPSALMPLWHIAGYLLGKTTSQMSKESAMGCTVAVEEVIDKHYEEQISIAESYDQNLAEQIRIFQAEELEHRDTGLEHDAEMASGYPILYSVISLCCKISVFLAQKI